LPQILHKKEKKLAGLLNSLKKYALAIDWQEARNIQLLNIKNGNNNIGISDILIAQNCIQNNLKLITHDKHFRLMAKCIPLQVRYADP
jgi:predicted nucleic acid-binding protein